jgi:hypothetical protein
MMGIILQLSLEKGVNNMQYFKLKYPDGTFKIVKGKDALEVIKKYDLATRDNDSVRVVQLEGEQLAIAQSNDESEA